MLQYVVIAVFGLAVGSFLNVVIWRVPRGKSIVSPSSRCPSCGAAIRPLDNIPVLSYLLLRGRCRYCGAGISARYPFVEALNAVLWAVMYWRFGMGWHLPVYLALASAFVAVVFIDLDFQIIPDSITLPGIPIALLAGMFLLPDPVARAIPLGWQASLAGAALGFGLFWVVAVLSRGGMGGGDIKFMAVAGAATGWKGVLMTTFLGSLAGSVIGVFLMIVKGRGRKAKIPFGPFLVLGALLTLLFGQEIMRWYLDAGR
ncbi:MAG: prepilin peptidase [Nitrospirota bacterium]|jgi:leader peptidase (prepilin peptidase)/N-methyltransferase